MKTIKDISDSDIFATTTSWSSPGVIFVHKKLSSESELKDLQKDIQKEFPKVKLVIKTGKELKAAKKLDHSPSVFEESADTKKFGQDLDSFLKKTKGGHLTPVNVQWVSSGEKNSSGRYFYDVLVYVNLQHGEKLAYLLNVVTKEDGTITRINYPESGITVGSNTPEQIVKQLNSIPADEEKYKTYKEETMKTDIAQIKSIAEAVLGVLSEASNTDLIKKLEALKAEINDIIQNTTTGDYQTMGNKAGDFINEYIDPAIQALKKGQDAKEALKDFVSMGSWYGSKTYYGSKSVKELVYSLKQTLGESLDEKITAQWSSDVKKVPAKIRDGVPMGAKVYVKHMGELADFYAYNDFKGGVHFWNVDKGEWTYAKNLDAAYEGHMQAMDDRTSYKNTF